jgi:glyoxylase-like metal-dependent hydrolase (beta-lactamase superfamily II)
VHVLSLTNAEFEGGNSSYVLERNGTVALVDTGIATNAVRDRFVSELADAGYAVEDVDCVFLTHWHADHAGLAGFVQAESEATVYVHEADAPLVRQEPDAQSDLESLWRRRFDEWGMPPEKRSEILAKLASNTQKSGRRPQPIEEVTDEDRIPVGDVEMEVVHTPGHTAGSSCFVLGEGERTFVGDTVLPVYTPNVGGADVRLSRPLERYLRSLDALSGRDFDRVWPGHRDVIESPGDRIDTIVSHHHERTARVLDVLRDRDTVDAWTVSARLFGELDGIHIMHGPGEAYAHLEHLVGAGIAERTGDEYAVVDPNARAEQLF